MMPLGLIKDTIVTIIAVMQNTFTDYIEKIKLLLLSGISLKK